MELEDGQTYKNFLLMLFRISYDEFKQIKRLWIGIWEKFYVFRKKDNVEYFIGLHSIKWIEENTLKEISNFLGRNKAIKLSLHICEIIEEVEYAKKNTD